MSAHTQLPPCPHLSALSSSSPSSSSSSLSLPGPNVTRPTECSQCFDDQDMDSGVDVCLKCFNGACPRLHAQAHADKFGEAHAAVVNIRRVRKPRRGHPVQPPSSSSSSSDSPTSAKRLSGQEPPQKKLAIREEPPEHEKYDIITKIKCYACGELEVAGNEKTDAIVAAILSAMSTARQSEVKAWEQELETCQHTRELVQLESKQLEQSGLAHCSSCELTQNLWLCLTCGDLNCGRQQFGGLGGNGHAVAHYSGSGHPVSVKLGTIQPNGTADIYCYACDDEKLDPSLSSHLSHFGIQVEAQVKTEKSLSELQVEQNMKFDFAMSGEDGKQLEPVFGPGLTGLRNLGNSCYMASVLQTLFALPAFSDRYYTKGAAHPLLCQKTNPATCFECQLTKIADGLLSGRYSHPRSVDSESNDDETAKAFASPGSGQPEIQAGAAVQETPSVPFQEGIQPSMFKSLVGRDHPEFSTMRQQDSEEFFKHLVNMIQKAETDTAGVSGTLLDDDASQDPTDTFKFHLQERLQCTSCKGVRYRVVPDETVSMPVPFIPSTSSGSADMETDTKGKESAEHLATGTALGSQQADSKFPETAYQPVTLDECLRLMCATSTTEYRCPSCAKTVTAEKSTKFDTFPETLVIQAKKFTLVNWVPRKIDVPLILPSNILRLDEYKGQGKQADEVDLPGDEKDDNTIEFNKDALQQLEGMGFPLVRCQKALLATGNADAEAAMNWLFGHMEDPDIDEPIPPQNLQVTSQAGPSGASAVSPESISMVQDMGFTADQARKALLESGGSVEAAVEWLFSNPGDPGVSESAVAAGTSPAHSDKKPRGRSDVPANYRLKAFISHKGSSIHVGHYVAHVHKPGVGWVLFNDEKVVKADGGAQSAVDLMPFAYLYVFERVDDVV